MEQLKRAYKALLTEEQRLKDAVATGNARVILMMYDCKTLEGVERWVLQEWIDSGETGAFEPELPSPGSLIPVGMRKHLDKLCRGEK